jgi:Protein of unknown function (DUF3990)
LSDLWDIPWITLYHGTVEEYGLSIVNNGVDVFKGHPNVDFGVGFYTTTWREQALQWAEKRALDDDSHGPDVVVQVRIDRRRLSSLRSMEYVRDTADYWRLVEHCRMRQGVEPLTREDFDMVCGPVMKSLGPGDREFHLGMDQFSFHSAAANTLLRDTKACKVELI